MSRGRCTFRQRDVTAAIRAAVAAGIEVGRVEIDKDGKITIITGKVEERITVNPLDAWRAKHASEPQRG